MKSLSYLLLIILVFNLFSCSPKSKYERLVKKELASGERHDSLFLGIYLGMPQKEFYKHCWDLNKKGLVKQGTSNTTVEYITKDELKSPATMNFYPEFTEGKISSMPAIFVYNGWAPWNKNLSADKLQEDVLKWYKKIYGNDFISIDSKERGTAYLKIDGNRRISIFKRDDMAVWVIFTDLLAKKNSPITPADTLNKKTDTLNLTEKN